MRALRSSRFSNTTARPSTSNSAGVAAAPLEDRAVGREAALQDDEPAHRRDRTVEAANHVVVDPSSGRRRAARATSCPRPSCNRDAADAAARAAPRRRRRPRGSPPCSLRPTGFRSTSTGVSSEISFRRCAEMRMPSRPAIAVRCTTGVRRAAERHQQAKRVLDRLRRDDGGGRDRVLRQANGGPARRLGRHEPLRIDGGNRCRSRQRHSQRFRDARHRARRAHDRAGAGRHRQPAFDFGDLVLVDFAGAELRPEAPAIGARAEALAVIRARSTSDPSPAASAGRSADAAPINCAGTVLSQPPIEHDGIHRLRADHLLDVHRHQVAEHHAGRVEEDLAQRNRSGTRAATRRPRARRARRPRRAAACTDGNC